MDYFFSPALSELIRRSRELAIDLGYDYISTVHFLMADCESQEEDSIFGFAFDNEAAYVKFREDYTRKEIDFLSKMDDSLPLTIEAAECIRQTEKERIALKHTQAYPFHLFIAALRNPDSHIARCFKGEGTVDRLIAWYRDKGCFDKEIMVADPLPSPPASPVTSGIRQHGVLGWMFSLLKAGKQNK